MRFELQDPDFAGSPVTGMARRHWSDAAVMLLRGNFRHFQGMDRPLGFPTPGGLRQPDPSAGAPVGMYWEGFSRTLLLSAPLLNAEPNLTIDGVRVYDYFLRQLALHTSPASALFIGLPQGSRVPSQIVGWAAVCMALLLNGDVLWRDLDRQQRREATANLAACAHARTKTHNWRYFNLLGQVFLARHGEAFDRDSHRDHMLSLLSWYAGDGWYRDGAEFDLYNAWAFHLYALIWRRFYGEERWPEAARVLRGHLREFLATYIRFFDRSGRSLLWGRSSVYRFAASAVLALSFLLPDAPVEPGFARRIASGNLLQFVTREDVFHQDVPTLGFYRTFPPVLHEYGGPPSPGWMHKIFAALSLPEDSAFWKAREDEGFWPALGLQAAVVSLAGPGLLVANYGATGVTELAPGKSSFFRRPDYTRLAYSSAFPWEDEDPAGVSAGTYAVRDLGGEIQGVLLPDRIAWAGQRDGVLYRQVVLGRGHFTLQAVIDLAEVRATWGVVRVDRIRIPFAYELTLGHYGLPGGGSQRIEPMTSVVSGDTGTLAAVGILGWDQAGVWTHQGFNPVADTSSVPYLRRLRPRDHREGTAIVVSALLHAGPGTEMPLQPVRNVEVQEISPLTGSPLAVRLDLTDGRRIVVDYGSIEGELRC